MQDIFIGRQPIYNRKLTSLLTNTNTLAALQRLKDTFGTGSD